MVSTSGQTSRWKYERYRTSNPSDPSTIQNSHNEDRCKMCLARAAEEADFAPRTPPTDFESKYYMDVGLDGEDSRPLGDDEIMSFMSGTESEGEMEEDDEDENDSEESESIPHRRTKFPACHGVCDVIVSGEVCFYSFRVWSSIDYLIPSADGHAPRTSMESLHVSRPCPTLGWFDWYPSCLSAYFFSSFCVTHANSSHDHLARPTSR